MAVYDPALMMQGDPTIAAVVYIVFKATVAILLWGSAAVGYLWSALNMVERFLAAAAAFSLVVALPVTDEIGFAVGATFIIWHWLRSHRR